MLTVETNPTGETYKKLINFLFETCDEFQLVVRTDIMEYQHSFLDLDTWFKGAFKEVHEQHEWPSTDLFDDTAKVYYFKTTDEAKKVILEHSNNFFDWSLPNLPEDLCFFKNGEAYVSVSSELKEIYIYPETQTETEMLKSIPGLKLLDIIF